MNPNPEDFKRRIVEKYPSGVASDGRRYSDMDATELTQKIVAKYPDGKTNDGIAYKDFLTPQQPKSLGQKIMSGAEKVSSFFGGKGIADFIGSNLAKATLPKETRQFVDEPSKKEVVGSALQLGSLFTPVGKLGTGLAKLGSQGKNISNLARGAGAIGAGATAGYGFDVGASLQEGQSVPEALKPGLGTVIGGAVPAIGVAAGALRRGAPSLKASAEKSYMEALGATTKPMKRMAQQVAPELAKRRVIAGTREGLSQRASGEMDTVGDLLEKGYEKLPQKAKADVRPIIDMLNKNKDELRIPGTKKVPDAVRGEYNALTRIQQELISASKAGKISVESLRGYRQLLDKAIKKSKGGFGMTGAENAKLAAQKTMANAIREEFSKQFPDIAKLNKEFTFWKKVSDITDETLLRTSSQRAPLGETILTGAGTAGGFASGGLGNAVGFGIAMKALSKVVNSTAWKTISGATKARIADSLSKGNFGEVLRVISTVGGEGLSPAPGDLALRNKGVQNYLKNPKLGLSLQDVSKTASTDLMKEARKYKTAEEFVKAQKETAQETIDNIKGSGYDHVINEDGTLTLYHKTNLTGANGIERSGFRSDSFFADSAESADALASTNKKGNTKTIAVKVDPQDVYFSPSTYEFHAEEALVKGRDGVYRAKTNQTKSQLTDIWNKANKLPEKPQALPYKETGDLSKVKQKAEIAGKNKELLVLHNLSEQKLRFADRIGGLVNPSTAVVNPKLSGFEGYGDITLVANKELIRGQKTHLADAYSPRFPSVHTSMEYSNFNKLNASLEPYYKKIGDDAKKLYNDDTDIVRHIENNPAVALKFLEEKGIKPTKEGQHYFHGQIQKLGMDSEYQSFLDDLYKKYGVKEQMFAGYTPFGNRRYKPVSIEEASKIMSKQKEEGFNYGLGSFRSKVAPIKRTPEAIKKEKGRLVTKENFDKIKESYDEELWALKDKLEPYAKNKDSNPFIESDRQLDLIGAILTGEKDSMKWFNAKFPDAPPKVVAEITKFRDKLKEMPTEYFETKFNRPVKLEEFSTALVPEGTAESTKQLLRSKGLEVIEYKKGQRTEELIKRLPVEAFGAGAIPFLPQRED